MPSISEARILIVATDGYEQVELTRPLAELSQMGATVHVASPEGAEIRGWDEDDWGETTPADLALTAVAVEDYDALVLPGGQINPDVLRTNADAMRIVRGFAEAGRPVAAICHAPWLLIEAGLAEGREMTAFPSIRTDLRNAGATVVDREVVVSGGVITSRDPEDLGAFVAAIVEAVERGGARAAA